MAGVPMANGSRAVEGYVPRRDATVVTRLLEAGASSRGRRSARSCASTAAATPRNRPGPQPVEPGEVHRRVLQRQRRPGRGGRVDMAVGGDQAGSVRIPAAFCGAVGHKPTHGLVPYTGAFPIESTIDHLGPITRTVRDAALMLGVVAGRDGLDPRQRRGTPRRLHRELDAGVAGLRVGVLDRGIRHPWPVPAGHRRDRPGGRRDAGGGGASATRSASRGTATRARMGRHRHRRRVRPDDGGQRLRHERARPV